MGARQPEFRELLKENKLGNKILQCCIKKHKVRLKYVNMCMMEYDGRKIKKIIGIHCCSVLSWLELCFTKWTTLIST